MSTRTTKDISRDLAERSIIDAIETGRLTNEQLADMMETVADSYEPERYNFRVSTGCTAEHDLWWLELASRA